jgi:outer membrane protein assembly factor BamB
VVYAMNASTGRLIWKTPVGEHSVSDGYSLAAMEHRLTLKAPYGNTILVPAGGPNLYGPKGGSPQLVAYTAR